MRVVAALALAGASTLAACDVAFAGAGDASPSLTILTPAVELGSVVPEQPLVAAAQLNVILTAHAGWQLALAVDAPLAANALGLPGARAAAEPLASDLSVRVGQQEWVPLIAGTVTPLLSGGATAPTGLALSFDLMAAATLDSPPGRRNARLRFVLNGQPVNPGVQLSWDVSELIGLATDSRPFQLTAPVDPTRAGTYPFDTRFITVSGNGPWVLEVGVQDRLTDAKSPRTLPDGSIVIVPSSGPPQPLLAGSSVILASGSAAGRAGRQVAVHLAVVIKGNEIAGEYAADLAVVAHLADAPVVGDAAWVSGRELHAALELARSEHALGPLVPTMGPKRWSLTGRVEDVLRLR